MTVSISNRDMGKPVTLSGITMILLMITFQSFAQFEIVPHPYNSSTSKSGKTAKRTKADPVLSLPFWDDFSNPSYSADGKNLFPNADLWMRPSHVWISNGIGLKAPTVNVATFDGLDSLGRAYNQNSTQIPGYTDHLESHFIDLSTITGIDQNSVFLSFFYQWQGNGEIPDDRDFLEVQFNGTNGWATVQKLTADPEQKSDTFYLSMIKVEGTQFFHDKFKFRIRSYGGQSGPYDTWNIDYVYLNRNRHEDDNSFPDQAISSPPTGFLPNQYRAMPYSHFVQLPGSSPATFEINNLRSTAEPMTFQMQGKFRQYTEGVSNAITLTSSELDITPTSPVIGGYQRMQVTILEIPDPLDISQFPPDADSVFLDLKARLFTGDNETENGDPAEDYEDHYIPIDFRVNDTLTTKYILKDYYAYDDGQAEYAVKLISSGNVAALEFELPDGLHPESALLKSFEFYFPPFGISSNQIVDFFVFAENPAKPGFPGESLLRRSSVNITDIGVNKFRRINFEPSITIPGKKFFIAWRQPNSGNAYVGLDMSNNTGSKLFFNPGTSITPDPNDWTEVTEIEGTLMIRPQFGIGLPDPTTGIEKELLFSIYPNPSEGMIHINGLPDRIEISNALGMAVSFESVRSGEQTVLTLHHAPPGLYLLHFAKGRNRETHKVLIRR